ncbi:MAG: flippase-like domain-containing protein [candidate division WOR-3 bacterium]|nr:MAG: flippase-like domain-containing protein [candidate division WOR-3 bacterium]
MKILRKVLAVVVVFVIFYFLITYLINNWQKIPFASLQFNITNLLLSFALLLVNFLLFIQGWKYIILRLGSKITFRTAFWIISLSQVAKYVPGGIWFALGRAYLGKAEKLGAGTIAVSVIIETGMTFLACILLLFLSVIFSRQLLHINTWFIVPLFIIFLILIQPSILNRLMNTALKIFKRPAINLDMSYLQLLELSAYFIGFLIAQLIGFFFLVNSIYPTGMSKIFELSAAYLLSWMAGFVVIFAPGGLGVREGVMTILLSSILPPPLAIAISFLARVWLTVFEIAVFLAGLIARRSSYRPEKNNA